MEKLIVQGRKKLSGSIRASGAKNAALPILAASLLAEGSSVLANVPQLSDIRCMQTILRHLGAKVMADGDTVTIDASSVGRTMIPESMMREMRASICLLGPLLGRFREVSLSYPGGCAIGPRPIDLHLKALEKLGARITESFGLVRVEAPRLIGAEVQLDFPSVGATENAMMAAVLADGVTILRNAAREPEIVDLAMLLRKMGARIHGAGSDTIIIHGVRRLHGAEHSIMPDRIEAGTFLLAGAAVRGEVIVEEVLPPQLFALIEKLREAGAVVDIAERAVRVRANKLTRVDIKTLPYPGFPTDLQAPMMAFLTTAEGASIVTETIFENRFKHVDELVRMGANIRVEGRSAVIRGGTPLTAAKVEAFDLRAGGALIVAALCAEGTTEIERIHYIDRGYERIEEKLTQLGASIIRKKTKSGEGNER